MKPPTPIRPAKTERGFALVIILSAIVLLLALVVGFFSRVQSEIQSSSSYQSAESARNLSDYAVNLVLTQIKAGTAGVDASGNPLAWASQPGAIRTYDTSGGLASVYKLYSSPAMVASSINPGTEAAALNTWAGSPALFSDLNEPLNGQYPILDPSAAGVVKGFSITGAPVATGAGANTAPMPANWLYVLKDGQIVAPTGSGNTANVTGASAANPIIGRVAFWTDDETSKININTAGGGPWTEAVISQTYKFGTASSLTYNGPSFTSYWTTPVVFSKQEGALAGSQPVKYEYQRYPGHPATTFLSAALPNVSNLDELYAILPRLENTNSSKGGSVLGGQGSSLQPVVPDANRLYQSVDELLFTPSLSTNFRRENTGLTKTDLERARFFLTANNRAPDVNLFNQPRISIWPINSLTTKRTPYDQLIAFCETINSFPYYFTRSNPDSATDDITIARNRSILDYLRNMTSRPTPGFGGTAGVLGKYGTDRNQIVTEIFDYIRNVNPRDTSQGNESFYFTPKLSGAVVPSYDAFTATRGIGRFPTVTKVGVLIYGVGINQEDADQTKSTAVRAEADTSSKANRVKAYDPTAGKDRIGPPGNETTFPAKNRLIMRALLLVEMFMPGQGYDFVYPKMKMDVAIGGGFQWSNGGAMFSGGSINFAADGGAASWTNGRNLSRMWGGRVSVFSVVGSADSISYPFAGSVNSPEVTCRDSANPNPSFTFGGGSLNITLRGPDGDVVQEIRNISFPPATLPVPDLAPVVIDDGLERTPPVPPNKLDFRFWDQRLKVKLPSGYNAAFFNAWITENDVVQMVSVQPADYRLTAAMKTVPGTAFSPHPLYGTAMRAHNFMDNMPTALFDAGLGSYADITKVTYKNAWENNTSPVYTFKANNWRKSAGTNEYTYSFTNGTALADTYTTSGVKAGSSNAVGDWDNGVGRAGDGPFINYPDEGYVRQSNTSAPDVPYLGSIGDIEQLGPSFFTPNRMMSSAAMLGSLPTGVLANSPWQTLHFRPASVARPGAGTPLNGPPFTVAPDYLLLDFFNMPVVEPYAISEPLSTAGRINMNYQILPYTYIERSTGVQAVLRSEQILAIGNAVANKYKVQAQNASALDRLRYGLNLAETIKGFQQKFSAGDIFRSPSEICSIWLVPDLDDNQLTVETSYANMPTWWEDYLPTGDNSKESSYARIYPRLTTKSNTYTVHYRVQALKKPKNSSNHAVWEEGKDRVQSEFRGSTTIERYIDPNDPNIPDYITSANPEPLDSFYKFRVIGQKHFNP